MGDGVQRDAPEALRRVVPFPTGLPRVGHLVEDHGNEQDGDADEGFDHVSGKVEEGGATYQANPAPRIPVRWPAG